MTKFFVRLLVAVVALAAVSCATDATQDLGVNLSEKTTLNLSWEKVRTQLGEKVDGAYPLYWSEGDQISVNGVASEPLTEEQSGKSSATFTVEGEFASFNVAYPAAEEGQVLFAEKQAHLNNDTFASGVTTVYGVGTTASDVALHYLTGFVKFGVTGSATLTKIEVAADNECALAGAFNIDFATGEVTPTEGASKVIEYSFGEGATLSEEPLYVHIAVPAGDYAKLVVTLYDSENGSTTRQINGGDIVAGKLLEMSTNVEYVADEVFDGLVIDSAEKLVELAANASAYSKVRVTADIDMSEVEWAPIEGFAGEFDGGNYTISGLKAPLFGTTVATSIKNVKLAVAINNYSGAFFGALACVMTNTEAVVENCSVRGNILINNTSNPGDTIRYGGLIGRGPATTNVWKNLTSYANITLRGTAYSKTIVLGGIIGDFTANELKGNLKNADHLGTINVDQTKSSGNLIVYGVCMYAYNIEDCDNGSQNTPHTMGKITVNHTTTGGTVEVTGLCRYMEGNTTNCHNYGDIDATINNSSSKSNYVAGLFSMQYVDASSAVRATMSNCSNEGDITVSGTMAFTSYFSGISANYQRFGQIDYNNVHNIGNITLASGFENSGATLLSGFSSAQYNNNSYTFSPTFTNCSNSGVLKLSGTQSSTLYLGGFACQYTGSKSTLTFTDCVNRGDIIVDGSATASKICIGGFIAETSKAISGATVVCEIASGEIPAGMLSGNTKSSGLSASSCNVGGKVNGTALDKGNYHEYLTPNSEDFAVAELEASRLGYVAKVGDAPYYPEMVANAIATPEALLAFATAVANGTAEASYTVTANIDMSGVEWTPINGFAGEFNGGADKGFKIKGLTTPLFDNTAASAIKNVALEDVDITVSSERYFGALACQMTNPDAVVENCSVGGKIKFTGNGSLGGAAFYGVLVGYGPKANDGVVWKNLTSNAEVTLEGSYNKTVVYGGLVAFRDYLCGNLENAVNNGSTTANATVTGELIVSSVCYRCVDMTNCTNNAPISVKATASTAIIVSGLCRYIQGDITNCHNSEKGSIYVDTNDSAGTIAVAGLFNHNRLTATTVSNPSFTVDAEYGTMSNCSNRGAITIEGKANNTAWVGGVAAGEVQKYGKVKFDTVTNSGDITFTNNFTTTSTVVTAGFHGGQFSSSNAYLYSDFKDCTNSGSVTFNGKCGDNFYCGGFLGQYSGSRATVGLENCANKGNITIEGATTGESYIGGFVGHTTKAIGNATAVCNITAIGYKPGMLVGVPYSEGVTLDNCKAGGTICREEEGYHDPYTGMYVFGPKIEEITAHNLYKYIYSEDTFTENVAGVTYLAPAK